MNLFDNSKTNMSDKISTIFSIYLYNNCKLNSFKEFLNNS
jgi:hypothetical protein